MSHHVTSADIPANGEHLDPAKVSTLKLISLIVAVLGSAVSVWLLFFAPEKLQGNYAYSWIFGLYFFLTLAMRETSVRRDAGAVLGNRGAV